MRQSRTYEKSEKGCIIDKAREEIDQDDIKSRKGQMRRQRPGRPKRRVRSRRGEIRYTHRLMTKSSRRLHVDN